VLVIVLEFNLTVVVKLVQEEVFVDLLWSWHASICISPIWL